LATLTVGLTNSSIKQFGQFGDGTINSLTGYRLWVGRDGGYEFKFTGTGLTVSLVAITTAPVWEVSIDGGAFADVTHGGASGVRSDDTLATGLSDALHTVIFRHKSGTQANGAIEIANAFTVTGAAPAVSDPDSWGTQYDANGAQLFAISRIPNAVRGDVASGGYSNLLSLLNPDSCIRWRGNATSWRMLSNLNAAKWRLFRDGTAVAATATLASTARFGWTTLCSGQDGADHEWELVSTSNAYTALQIQTIMGVGGTISATRATNRHCLLCIGDSQFAGNGTADSSTTFGSLLAHATNRDVINLGLASSRVCTFQNFSTALSAGQRMGEFTNFRYQNVDKIVILYQHNDAVAQTALADYNREYTRMLTNLRAAYPTADIICLGMLPTSASITPITRANYVSELSSLVTALADAKVTFVSQEATDFAVNWVIATDQTDGVHQSATGNGKQVTRLQGFISSASDVSSSGSGCLDLSGTGGLAV
jgi:lysophospholipase L1-like esterase